MEGGWRWRGSDPLRAVEVDEDQVAALVFAQPLRIPFGATNIVKVPANRLSPKCNPGARGRELAQFGSRLTRPARIREPRRIETW